MTAGTINASVTHTVDQEGNRRFHVGLHRHGVQLSATLTSDRFVKFIESLHEHILSVKQRGHWMFDFVWPSKTEFHMITLSVDSGEELVKTLEAEWFYSLWTKEDNNVQAESA